MKDLPGIKGRHYIMSLVAEGEHSQQDFKFAISDARKIARSVSAFANAGGGRLLIGVKDNGTIAGVRNEEDIYVVEQAASRYCRPSVEVEFTAFRTDPDKVVIRASIPKSPSRPVRCQEPDGQWKAYFRVNDENIVAHPLMVAAWESEAPVSLHLDETVQRALDFVDANPEGVDDSQIAAALGISQRRTKNLVVKLVNTGILSFAYDGHHFRIIRNNP